MNKRIGTFVLIVLALIALGLLAYTSLEIAPRKVPVPPSRDVLANDYYALQKWLAETGHPVRLKSRVNPAAITAGAEKAAFVQADLCKWEEAEKILRPWMEDGAFLVITMKDPPADEDLAAFLAGFGISAEAYPPADGSPGAGEISEGGSGREEEYRDGGPDIFPDFFRDLRFHIAAGNEMNLAPGFGLTRAGEGPSGAAGPFTMKDRFGDIRLIRVPLGKGALTVLGRPRFMFNNYIRRDINARLAWELTGALAGRENPGLLFVRGRRAAKSLFGKIADRGNFLPLVISAALLVILGFRMLVPSFGPVFKEKKNTARPIRDRFLAEIGFLKKYHALDSYLAVCVREISQRQRGREEDERIDREIETIEGALARGRPLKHGELIRSLEKLEGYFQDRAF
jgi:hypothetical protein